MFLSKYTKEQFENADNFFVRNIEDYVQRLKDNIEKLLPFVLNDLRNIPKQHGSL